MGERIKTGILIFLIFLSLALTYRMWFGTPPLEKGMTPRFEYTFLTEYPAPEEIITPAAIIFLGEDEHVFRRGEKEYMRLWREGTSVLKRLKEQSLKRVSDAEEEELLETAPSRLGFVFSPPLPVSLLQPEELSSALEIVKATIIQEEHYYLVILEGEEKFAGRVFMNLDEQLLDNLSPQRSNLHLRLSETVTLDLLTSTLRDQAKKTADHDPEDPDIVTEDTPEEAELAEQKKDAGEDNGPLSPQPEEDEEVVEEKEEEKEDEDELEAPELLFSLELRQGGEIYVPLDDLQVAEVALKKEDVDRDRLVRAFFFDQSMARRIEERDGAVFFTDGEKGLRIYPDGLVEYTAPRLERVSLSMSYSAAVQKGAENLGLYGGWYPGTYLVRTEKGNEGYRLFWETVYEGLPFRGGRAGSEMVVNELGVPFYRRNFFEIVEEIGERKPFRPFEEALCRAVSMHRDFFSDDRGVLLKMEPVYYLTSMKEEFITATPAWAISIAGLDNLYLHWQTLEPL